MLKDQTAIVGIGETEFSKSIDSTELNLACKAIKIALDDAGINPDQVDALGSFTYEETPEFEIARNLGFGNLTYWSQAPYGGGASCAAIGQVAMAMMEGAKSLIAHDVPQYEIALAQAQAGTRKAAELLKSHYPNSPNMSPNIHFLPVITSGKELPYTHRRASTKLVKKGEPVFCCYCGSTNFHRFKLGFDRVFWVNEIKDKSQIKAFEVAVKSQQAALSVLGPGVTAEEVHAAYADTIQTEGYPYPTFRCGRGTGFSFLEEPQLVVGNKTVLKPGMVFAVDGGSSAKDFRGQVGDSFIITEDGYEQITHHSKAIEDLILN